ncbi:MAG: hypothetical protein KDJ14_15655 [Xanthomonadales bacterium]|nr:hypothetical protein [Xanthomonadales bacterium]
MATPTPTDRLANAALREGEALTALCALLGQDMLLGLSSLLRCALWLVLGVAAALAAVVLIVAGVVAAAIWFGLPAAWALLLGAASSALLALACVALARRRLGTANLAATRRQCRAWLLALAGEPT